MVMKWFNNLKVATKVLLSCLIFLILILVISANSYFNMKKAGSAFENFYSNRFLAALQLGNSNIAVQKIKANMLLQQRAAERKDLKEVERMNVENKTIAADYQKNISAFMALQMPDNEKKLAEQFTAGAKYAVEARNKYTENLLVLNTNESAKWLLEYIDRFGKAVVNIEQLVEIQMKEGKRIQDVQNEDIRTTNLIILIILCASLGIGLIITIVLSRSVSGPVKKGLAFAELIAAGNFLERIDLDQKDELGQLAKALNISADNLEKLISEIIFSSQNLVRAVEEIASGNENLSQRTSEQASSLEEIAATVEEANASTKQNSGNAVEASKLSDNSSKMAVEGGQIVENAVFAIGEINSSSKKISEILNMINEIAFQTNLLALNAAVEAARAGEQGRGFAVVAGEVRNLAQRAASAAKDIGGLIKDSISKIDEGTELVNRSGEALKEIIASAKQVNDIISEIAASSDEQSRGIEQINTAITDMDTMTQQNAALVEETAAASEEMSNQAQELLSMVQQFKIRDGMRNEIRTSKKDVHIHKLKTQVKDTARESVDKMQPGKSAQTEAKNSGAYNPETDGYEKF